MGLVFFTDVVQLLLIAFPRKVEHGCVHASIPKISSLSSCVIYTGDALSERLIRLWIRGEVDVNLYSLDWG